MQQKVPKEASKWSSSEYSQKSDQDLQPPDQIRGQQVCTEQFRPACEFSPIGMKWLSSKSLSDVTGTSKLSMDSISSFMPANSNSFGNSVSYQRKGFSKLLVSKSSFHPDLPKQEPQVHVWCQRMKFENRMSKAFETTMSVMESQAQ